MQKEGQAITPADAWQLGADLADASRILLQDGSPDDAARFHEQILEVLGGTADPTTARQMRAGYASGAQAQLADLRGFETMRREQGGLGSPTAPPSRGPES